jgi:uncharacterized surface protein with fasciclin (FAS1) repeats
LKGTSTFATRFVEAEVGSSMSDDQHFTVFVPSDAAFRKLPEKVRLQFVEIAHKPDAATSILRYHVLPAELTFDDLAKRKSLTSLNGQRLRIDKKKNDVYINDVKVRLSSIKCDNATIYEVDEVLLPSDMSILQQLEQDGRFSKFLTALEATGLDEMMRLGVPFTVFAPTDKAIDAAYKAEWDELSQPEAAERLRSLLKRHLHQGRFCLDNATSAVVLDGSTIRITREERFMAANGVPIVSADVQASNGVIHVLASVLPEK